MGSLDTWMFRFLKRLDLEPSLKGLSSSTTQATFQNKDEDFLIMEPLGGHELTGSHSYLQAETRRFSSDVSDTDT